MYAITSPSITCSVSSLVNSYLKQRDDHEQQLMRPHVYVNGTRLYPCVPVQVTRRVINARKTTTYFAYG
jgi:hypothetical protein